MLGVYWCQLNFYIRTTIAPIMKMPICNKARTSVQFPPAPPYPQTRAAKDIHLAAFFFAKSVAYATQKYSEEH